MVRRELSSVHAAPGSPHIAHAVPPTSHRLRRPGSPCAGHAAPARPASRTYATPQSQPQKRGIGVRERAFHSIDAEEPSLYEVWRSNINELVPHKYIGKLGFGSPFKCLLCSVTPVNENYDTDMMEVWDRFGKLVV